MRSYEAARSLFSFLAFMAWTVIIIGILVALAVDRGLAGQVPDYWLWCRA